MPCRCLRATWLVWVVAPLASPPAQISAPHVQDRRLQTALRCAKLPAIAHVLLRQHTSSVLLVPRFRYA